MNISNLPILNAILNGISTIFLVMGWCAIINQKKYLHIRFMIIALISSGLFLIFYLLYHYSVGSVPYNHYNWTRPVYFSILITHVILATVMVPFILAGVWFAWKNNFDRHAKVMRKIFPIWLYVSITGVLIFIMLYGF